MNMMALLEFSKILLCEVRHVKACKSLLPARKFSETGIPVRKLKNRFHVYSSSLNWDSSRELSRHLAQNVIMNKDGLVIINKPYGVGKYSPVVKVSKLSVERKLNTGVIGQNYFLQDILPVLASLCGHETLEVVKIPERFTSGVTILSSSEELSSHVKECIRIGKAQKILLDSYWAVCLKHPHPENCSSKLAIQYETSKITNETKPLLITSWSKNAVQRGDAVPVNVEHSTLFQSHHASLVEIKPSRTKNHFIRLYMCYVLSPLLGDNLYGSRVQEVNGVPVSISPFSDRAQMPPRLNDSLLASLDLRRTEEKFIPAHLHLRQVSIPHFHGKNNPLVLEAPVPEFFKWTCIQLRLKEPLAEEKSQLKC